jgi:putative spermidine/putrescine transport system substrate-binding protein
MMNRRQFLWSLSAGSAGLSLSACGSNTSLQPQVLVERNTIPSQIFRAFRQAYPYQAEPSLRVVPNTQIAFQQLQENLAQTGPAPRENQTRSLDLISLGDGWLQAAILQNLIEPLKPDLWSNWSQLDSRWQGLVQRDNQGRPNQAGQIWAAPFRWGTTVIMYRRSALARFNWRIERWSDLWRPELKQRLSLPDDAREVIGLTLKRLGYSYNTPDPEQRSGLKAALGQLQRQVKLYSSDDYLKPLLLEDTWVAVGWSTDIIPLLRRDRRFGAILPLEGTALWADCWVKPSSGTLLKAGVRDWINFCWSSTAASLFYSLGDSAPVVPLPRNPGVTQDLLGSLLLPPAKVLKQSEVIVPLSLEATNQYEQLWQKMRRGQLRPA